MEELPVPVKIDPQTGVWSVDGQPMILIPRHFWVFLQMEMEEAIGVEAARDILFEAARKAARVWCERESRTHGISGLDVFRHYLKKIGQRGLGRFTIEEIDLAAGTGRIRLEQSVYVAEYGPDTGRNVCYMFTGAFVGGLGFAVQAAGGPAGLKAEEVQCGAAGAEFCRVLLSPLDGG